MLAAVLFGLLVSFFILLDGEFSCCWFELLCFTLDIERCFLRSDNVCDWGVDVEADEFVVACEGLLLVLCVGENELGFRPFISGDTFSGDEEAES